MSASLLSCAAAENGRIRHCLEGAHISCAAVRSLPSDRGRAMILLCCSPDIGPR
jgi:hypothetical protein